MALDIPSTPSSPDAERTPTQQRTTFSHSSLRPASPTPSNGSTSTLTGAIHSGPPGTPKRPRTPNAPVTPPASFPTSSSSPELSERKKSSRARDLLRKHYGLAIGPPAPTGKPSDPMDIDSPAFNAKAYYEQLITTSSLPVLLKRENDLLTEIRELDSERQSLVYNHHHELIAASDTISAVKTRAEALEFDLDKLKDAFSEISRLCAEVTFESHTAATPNPSERTA